MEVVSSNPIGLQSYIPWEFSVSLPDPQAGKSVGGPRTFATVQERLWYNFSPVCQLSVHRLYSRANGDLLQENVCHMLNLPGLLKPEPHLRGRPLLTHATTGDTHSKAGQAPGFIEVPAPVPGYWCT